MEISKFQPKQIFLVLAPIFLFVNYLLYKNYLSWGGDYALYLLQAKALSDGIILDEISLNQYLLGLSKDSSFSAIAYPMGFSALISISSFLHNWDISLLKLFNPISMFLIIFLFIKANPKSKNVILFSSVFLFSPYILNENLEILPDLPSLFLYSLSIYCLSKNKVVLSGIFLFLSIIFKIYFLVLGVFHIFYFFQKKEYRQIIKLLFVCISLKFLTDFVLGTDSIGNYGNTYDISKILAINLERFQYVTSDMGYFIINFTHPINFYIGLIIFLFVAINYKNIYSLTFFTYMSFLFLFEPVWSHTDYKRYLIPAFYLLINILVSFFESKEFKWINSFGILYLCFLLFVNFLTISDLERQRGPMDESFYEVIEFVSNKEFNDDIFAFHSPRPFRYFTGRNSFRKDYEVDFPHYVVCEKRTESCQSKNIVFENNKYIIYK